MDSEKCTDISQIDIRSSVAFRVGASKYMAKSQRRCSIKPLLNTWVIPRWESIRQKQRRMRWVSTRSLKRHDDKGAEEGEAPHHPNSPQESVELLRKK
jgi:hypothetical protein